MTGVADTGADADAGTDAPGPARLRLQLFGPLAVWRDGAALALPPSRKLRALLAYLAMTPHAVARDALCELLWDLPNDPRGELRWGLSKLRGLLDAPGLAPLRSEGDMLRLDRASVAADAPAFAAAVQAGLAALPLDRLQALADGSGAEFLQGLEIERSAPWSAWLLGQRRRLRAARAAVLEQLAGQLEPGSDAVLAALEQWLRLAPFDRQAHARLLDALARRGRLREGDEHLAAAARAFEAEAQDWAPLGVAWREARLRHAAAAPAAPAAPGGSDVSGVSGTLGLSGMPALLVPGAPAGLALARVDDLATLASAGAAATPTRRASLAVMPFVDPGVERSAAADRGLARRGSVADGLAFDVITRLAKLRSLFVIAPGTVFALDAQRVGAEEAARRLDVDYVASGQVRRAAGRIVVAVQLVETRSARIVWADELVAQGDETFALLDEIGNRIVASIAQQVEQVERHRAILKPPATLDAWEAHHRGLWHMVRFNPDDNAQARQCFELATRLDPGFSRAWAGLSFTHFQDAFLGWAARSQAVEQAYRMASQGLMADDLDPATHWAMGRAQWLRGQLGAALAELDTAVELSPNFALGHYTRGFIHAQSGDPRVAIAASDQSRGLSPFDPMLFAMLASRALALMRLGRHDEAADWARKAVARPNAHVHIHAIAAHCLALAGRLDEAKAEVAAIRQRQPGYGVADFVAAFRFDTEAEALVRTAARGIGLG